MEYLRDFYRKCTEKFTNINIPNREFILEVSRLDAYFNMVYKVLLWEDPILSWIVLGFFHIIFWIIVQFELRLYGIIFFTILVGFLTDLYCEKIGLQAVRNEHSDAIREVFNLFQHAYLHLKVMRKENPSVFCVLMCTIFLSMSILSKNIDGFFLAYLVLMTLFVIPFLISRLPEEYKTRISVAVYSLSTNEGILAETELIPFISNKEMAEKDPELESLLTDKTADSVTSSLISGIQSMPSYLEAEGSLDGLDEDDLVPNVKPSTAFYNPDNSSDSDSDHKNIKFESTHFNGDSSSDDEKQYAAGLRFSEVTGGADSPAKLDVIQETVAQNLALGLLSNLTAVGSSIMSNVLSGGTEQKPKRKDSDSDFEIINADEADEQI